MINAHRRSSLPIQRRNRHHADNAWSGLLWQLATSISSMSRISFIPRNGALVKPSGTAKPDQTCGSWVSDQAIVLVGHADSASASASPDVSH